MSAAARIVWSDAALALFQLDRSTAVSAGAGSGKTTALVELCVRLLSGEATGSALDPAEIVAITFTEKAAEELEERLRGAVLDRALAARGAGDGEQYRRWSSRLHALDAMAIGTIHGFAMRLLREHALEAGLDPEFALLDEETAQEWRHDAALAAVVAAADAAQPEAVALAAALGVSGGRGALAEVIADLARERATRGLRGPVEPAPADAGAAEAARTAIGEAVRDLLAMQADVRTATGAEALERLARAWHQLPPGIERGPLTAEALWRLGELPGCVKGWKTGKNADAAAAKERLRAAASAFVASAAAVLATPQVEAIAALVTAAEERYASRKAADRLLDFDDLLSRGRDLLRGDAGVRAALHQRVRALLVDEYQDVNPLQQELFDLLRGDEGQPGPVLVGVGDLKQSIYRFRGADVSVFRRLIERMQGGAGRVLHLSANHRSSPEILDVVNAVSASCMQPPGADARPYELAFADEDRLVPVRASACLPACEVLEDGDGGRAAERREREAEAIAARIRAIVSGEAGVVVRERGPGGDERARRPRHGDVAVLFRRLTQVREYEQALRSAGIPFRLGRGGGFYQAPEVRDLGELLASLFEPTDSVAWAALLRSPLCGVGDDTLLALSREGLPRLAGPGAAALARRAAVDADEAARLARFLDTWHALRLVRDRLAVGELLERAVDALDLEAAHLAASDGERRVANVRKAVVLAHDFARRGGARAFSRRLRALARRPPREPEAELDAADAVAVLSVHQSKGLEWPIVFVPDLGAAPRRDARRCVLDAQGRLCAALWDRRREEFVATTALDAAKAEAARADAAESRRLLYVALTRARDRLILSGEPGRAAGETWRALVEPALAGHHLAVRVPAPLAATFAVGPAVATEGAAPPPTAPAVSPPRLRTPRLASAPRLPVTALAEYARCPRRLALMRSGAVEQAQVRGGIQDDPGRATSRGTLAHAMIAEVDLGAPPLQRRAQLVASARRRGYDGEAKGVRRIAADVWRFLESREGRALAEHAARGRLRRELPFLLRLDGDGAPPCYLVGAIDALVEAPAGVTVVDFKYALPRRETVERYRNQLLAYALAATRARPGMAVRASLQFLRGDCASVDVTPTPAQLERFAREAPFLAARAASGEEPPSAAALGRTADACAAEGCGFVSACYRSRVPAPIA